MCGIVGTIGIESKALLNRMNNIQFHRGPNEAGEYWDEINKVGLAMRRLSIVDIENGSQPVYNENKNVLVVFNGEIFNAPMLRRYLEKQGHIFLSKNSDTEILVHLYEEEGVNMVKSLNGMFAFAIFDKEKEKLFCARDYAGMKPFYFCQYDDKFVFASELKSIIQNEEICYEIDYQAIFSFMTFQCIPAPNTIYKNVKKLGAGEALTYDMKRHTLKVFRYWDVSNYVSGGITEFETAKETVREGLDAAVSRWRMSDVPTACLLSGGLDSASLVALLSNSSSQKVNTYTLGFGEERNLDERELARIVSRKYGTHHIEVVLRPEDILSDIEDMVYYLDEPYSGGIPSWYMYKEIGKDYKVAFTGVGGDELFGNYGKWVRYYSLWERIKQYRSEIKKGACIGDLVKSPYTSIYHKSMPKGLCQKIILDEHLSDTIAGEKRIEEIISQNGKKEWKDLVPIIDFNIQLPDEFLFMTDRFSMAHSVEARTPFLDKEFIQLILGIHANIRTNKRELKGLLKAAVSDLLPGDFLNAPKRGFVIPYQKWLRNDMRKVVCHYFSKEYVRRQGIFVDDIEEMILRPFLQGRNEYTQFVWNFFMFQQWYEIYQRK